MKNKKEIEETLRQTFEHALSGIIERYLSLNWATISQNEYFTKITKECYNLYIYGYYVSSIMVSQAINEAFARYWIEKNNHQPEQDEKKEDSVKKLVEKNILPIEWQKAFKRIQGSFRNDYHHINPDIKNHPHKELAERNLKDLAFLESEMFKYSTNKGKIVLMYPQYWNIKPNDMIDVFINFE